MQEKTVHPQPQGRQDETQEQKSLEELLAEAQAKIEQQRDTMMRAIADAENARKRAQAEATSARKYAIEAFAEGLLPVVDSLEAALRSGHLAGDISGIELTHKQLTSALEKSGLRPIDPKAGERFDPYRHQAMAAVEADAEPNSVVNVMQKGYALHDRVLRPALVTVAKTLENKDGNPISDTDLD